MIVQTVLLTLALLVSAAWAARHVLISRHRRHNPPLVPDPDAPLPEGGAPALTVIVPAKDEEANIADCLATLRDQNWPDLEIIVVDDRSTDRTAEVARGIAAADPRVRLVQVTELPEGWFGKSHAMAVASREARGDWLLFVDADCRLTPGSIRTTMRHTLDRGGDMLSLWPMLELKSVAENAVLPLCGSLLAISFRPDRVNDPRSRAAFANGQFVLVRRTTYEAVGGHGSVRDRLVEDIAFARVVKGAGHRLLNAVGLDIFRTRMYDSLGAIWRGWTRIYSGAWQSPWSLVGLLALVLVVSVFPIVLAIGAAAAAAAAGWQDAMLNALAAVGGGLLVLMATVLVRYWRLGRARPGYLVLYPFSVLVVLGVLVNALRTKLGLAGVTWRGTTYRKV